MSHATSPARLVIVGMGDDGLAGLTDTARSIVQQASLLLASPSILRRLEGLPGDKRSLEPEMTAALAQVRQALESEPRPVLVSSGDPLFYGITRYLCERLGKDHFEIIPHVSSMQLAFSRVKESWDDAYLGSLDGRSLEGLIRRIRLADKVGLFSSEDCPPSKLARAMLDRGLEHYRAYVCENLGSPDERVTQATLRELVGLEFDPLHVLILVKNPQQPEEPDRQSLPFRFGNPDEAFLHNQPRRVVVTQAEVRALALAQLNIADDAIVWDIGAGSGSVAIEAARLAPRGRVYAVEPRPTEASLIEANAEGFGVSNLEAIVGRAPEALASLPDPHAIFIGGTGRHVGTILKAAFERLRPGGRVVINVAVLDHLVETHRLLKDLAGEAQVWSISVARAVEQFDHLRFQALNPSFLLAATRPDSSRSGS